MIVRIEALNYKCLRYVRQDIGQFQVLVGPNASGKSTFLDVIAFLRDILFEGPEEAVGDRASNPRRFRELVWQGAGNRIELAVEMQMPYPIEQKTDARQPTCRYEVAIGNSEDDPDPRILVEALLLLREPSARERTKTPISNRTQSAGNDSTQRKAKQGALEDGSQENRGSRKRLF